MKELRLAPHNAFTRKTRIAGEPGTEMQVTIKSVGCRHGRCTFCSLGKIDSAFSEPLSRRELLAQLRWAKGRVEGEAEEIRKVSLICNAHSVIEPDAVKRDALKAGIHYLQDNFPALAQLSLESRVNTLSASEISRITRAAGYPPLNYLELAVGIESGSERVRNREMRKGLTDVRIYEAARMLADYGWAMRAYFIYNCPGRPHEAHAEDFKEMAHFLAMLKQSTGGSLTLYANRGYVPEGLAKRFRGYVIADEPDTVAAIISAAEICRKAGMALDADVTGSDEALTNASALEIKEDFANLISEFNATQEAKPMLDWLARHDPLLSSIVRSFLTLAPKTE